MPELLGYASEHFCSMATQAYRLTASAINVDPVVSGKHIGASQLIELDWQHSYETTASACSVYWFNNYEHRCKPTA